MKNTVSLSKGDVGVIVGRFQVHELHEAHKALIETVKEKHDRVMVFLGLSPLRNTINNPLDFNTRKRMFQEEYPEIEVYYVEDVRDDELWSKNLDREISKWLKPHQIPVLYGSRDSFISHYKGKFSTIELDSSTYISGTEIRRRIANNYPPTKEFRAGVISASFTRFPTCYQTVDIAIIDAAHDRILMGKKKNEPYLRFIGGFSDPNSNSLEDDCKREVMEETGVEVDNLQYIGSTIINDWRYRGEIDKIKTAFFAATYVFGRPVAGDDIEYVEWVSFTDLMNDKIELMPEHNKLLKMLVEFSSKTKQEGPSNLGFAVTDGNLINYRNNF